MKVGISSCRSALTAAVTVAAIAVAPSVAPPPRDVVVRADAPTPIRVVTDTTVELLAAIRRVAPAIVPDAPTAGAPGLAVAAAPVPLNAASDAIVNAWNTVLPWIDYGVDLTDYVLGFIPGLYLIGDQVSIVYYSLVRPVANSFVVNLVAPVVNDPLNINTWVNGLATLGTVTVNSLINLGINEFNYFFGWLVPPIPPIGPFAAVDSASTLGSPIEAMSALGPTDSTEMKQDPGLAKIEGVVDDGDQTPVDGDQTVVNEEDLGATTDDVKITTEDVTTETEDPNVTTPAETLPAESTPSVENVEPVAAGAEGELTPPPAEPVTTPATLETPKSPSTPTPVRAKDRTGDETHERGAPGDKTPDSSTSPPQKRDKVNRPSRGERPDSAKRSGEKPGHAAASNDSGPKRTKAGAGQE
jgi:hypothetical protein